MMYMSSRSERENNKGDVKKEEEEEESKRFTTQQKIFLLVIFSPYVLATYILSGVFYLMYIGTACFYVCVCGCVCMYVCVCVHLSHVYSMSGVKCVNISVSGSGCRWYLSNPHTTNNNPIKSNILRAYEEKRAHLSMLYKARMRNERHTDTLMVR